MAIVFSDALKVRETLSSNWEDIALQVEGQPGKGIPPGGLLKQVIVKQSAADYNVIWASIVDLVYPIGSIYMSVNNVSPAVIFGGTWEQIEDTFLLAAGQSYTAGTSGGEATHTLTNNELPSNIAESLHFYGYTGTEQSGIANSTDSGSYTYALNSGGNVRYKNLELAGGGQAHNNMPPYLAVYMWKRTA